MRYKNEVTINLPREKVVKLFNDPDNLAKWQQGLLEMEHVSGVPGEKGAVTKMVYEMNGRKETLTETIITNDLPNEFIAVFEANNVKNIHRNYFYEEGPDKTRYSTDTEFEFSGLMRIISFFMGGAFRRQTLDDMNRFKEFAESQ